MFGGSPPMSRSKTVKQIREKKIPPQRHHQKSRIAPPIATMVCRYDFKTEEKTSPMWLFQMFKWSWGDATGWIGCCSWTGSDRGFLGQRRTCLIVFDMFHPLLNSACSWGRLPILLKKRGCKMSLTFACLVFAYSFLFATANCSFLFLGKNNKTISFSYFFWVC